MSLVEVPKVRLYVKSLKKAAGTENVVIDVPITEIVRNVVRVFPTHEVKTVTKYEYELPEEQEQRAKRPRSGIARLNGVHENRTGQNDRVHGSDRERHGSSGRDNDGVHKR